MTFYPLCFEAWFSLLTKYLIKSIAIGAGIYLYAYLIKGYSSEHQSIREQVIYGSQNVSYYNYKIVLWFKQGRESLEDDPIREIPCQRSSKGSSLP